MTCLGHTSFEQMLVKTVQVVFLNKQKKNSSRTYIKDCWLTSGSQDDVMVLLVYMHEEFKGGNFAKGKYLWFQQFDQFRGLNGIDSHGSEDECFFCLFRNTRAYELKEP
jgi:hypothetical protein